MQWFGSYCTGTGALGMPVATAALRPLQVFFVLNLLLTAHAAAQAVQQAEKRHGSSAGALSWYHYQRMLQEAEVKLLGNDSNSLDVAGAVQTLLQVHEALKLHMRAGAVHADLQSAGGQEGEADHSPLQQWQSQDPEPDSQEQSLPGPGNSEDSGGNRLVNTQGPRARRRQSARPPPLRRKVQAANQLKELGRASFMLAALSASGLITEHLPAQNDGFVIRDALCKQLMEPETNLKPGGGRGKSRRRAARGGGQVFSNTGSSSSSADCKVVTTDGAALRELDWLLTAAQAGTLEAQMALADRFLMGRGGVSPSCPDGLVWLQKAATAAMHAAEAAGNWDLTPSFIRLRERFIDMSTPQSYSEWDEEAMTEQLQAAAAFGSSDSYAQRRLGYRQLLGKGLPVDYRAAYESFVAAADGGNDGYALYNLGYMYLKGWYVKQDYMQALQYFKRALERGVGAAANAIGVLAATSTDTLPPDYNAAARWFEKGANMSDPDSIYNMGSLYLHGKGVAKDAQSALTYYATAFDLGHWKASYALGLLYAGDEPGLGHNCEYAEKYLWQFVSQRSSWLTTAQTALRDYDSPSLSSSTPQSLAPSERTTQTEGADGPGSEARSPAPMPLKFRVNDRYLQALVRYLMLAESGCEAAAENAAWMLLHGQGASGPRAVGLAAHLLYRSSILNHTSSMVELARLLLNESITTHPQQLLDAVSASGNALATGAVATNVSLGLLHHVLLQQSNAFMPPVGGPTACTGFYRKDEPPIVHNVSNQTAVVLPTGRSNSQRKAHGGTTTAGEAAGLVLWRARRAAVAWLSEASSVGDAEASALLAWLWHEGVLQGSRAQQEALAVINRALSAGPQPGQQSALQLVQTLIWLEQFASNWLGSRAVQAVRSALEGLRDAAVNVHGMHPLVLEMPDGFTTASTHMPPGGRSQYPHRGYPATGWAAQLSRTWLVVEQAMGSITAGHFPGGGSGARHAAGDSRQSTGKGWWEAIGADKVDKENLILTVLLGTLAVLLWLRRRPAQRLQEERQQGDAATRAQPGQPPTRQLPAGAAGEALRQPRELPRPQL